MQNAGRGLAHNPHGDQSTAFTRPLRVDKKLMSGILPRFPPPPHTQIPFLRIVTHSAAHDKLTHAQHTLSHTLTHE